MSAPLSLKDVRRMLNGVVPPSLCSISVEGVPFRIGCMASAYCFGRAPAPAAAAARSSARPPCASNAAAGASSAG